MLSNITEEVVLGHWEKGGKTQRSEFVRDKDVGETLPYYHPLGLGFCSPFSPLH